MLTGDGFVLSSLSINGNKETNSSSKIKFISLRADLIAFGRTGTKSFIRDSENRKAPKTEHFFHGAFFCMYVYFLELSLVRASLCLKFYSMFYLKIKR